jgi:Mg2+-importing ATPase
MARKQKNKRLLQMPGELNQKLLSNASMSNDEVLDAFHTSYEGLDLNQYEKNKEQYGPNSIGSKKKHQWYHSLFEAIFNPFSIILIVIAILDVAIPTMRS